jgi:hypothetical protein
MHDLSPQIEQPKLFIPRCSQCGGRGYTGCDQAHNGSAGCFLAIAFRLAVACSCPAGREFLDAQLEWVGRK